MQEVRYRETGETALAGEQSFLHEAICLLCRTEVSSHDGQRCSERVETGLAHGKDTGKGVHAGAVAAQSGGSARAIGIDEISLRKGHTYRIVVSDLERGKPIWFGGEDRSERTLICFTSLGPKKSKED